MNLQTLHGATLSKTVWLGLVITVCGYIQTSITFLSPWLEQKYIGLLNMALGLAVIVVRFYTDNSLADKVAK